MQSLPKVLRKIDRVQKSEEYEKIKGETLQQQSCPKKKTTTKKESKCAAATATKMK